jgi:spermidine synthase
LKGEYEMDLWLKEAQIENAAMTYKIKETLHTEKTKYQDLAVVDTFEFGRMLLLDGIVQLTARDEFVYHEMITHVPLFTHKSPKKVLVIGGGDGGVIREVLNINQLKKPFCVKLTAGWLRFPGNISLKSAADWMIQELKSLLVMV